MIQDRVLVRQDPAKKTLKSGLYVPDSKSRELQEDIGTVVRIGPGCYERGGRRIPPDVQIGDRVLFRRKPGSALCVDPREGHRLEWEGYVAIRETDIIGVIEE